MYWRFDANKFALHQLPLFLRKKGIYAIIKCLMIGVDRVHSLFSSQRLSVSQQLKHNGTVISLEKFLNDKFSLTNEIYITEYLTDNKYLYYDGEMLEDVYMGYQGEDETFELSSVNPNNVSGGFAVMIPEGLATEENIAVIQKWVDYYRTAGTIYKIESYE